MSADPLSIASVFLNSYCILAGNAVCAFIGIRTFFSKRHALYVFCLYFVLKMALVSTLDVWAYFEIASDSQEMMGLILLALINISAYAVLYYTWDASPIKVTIVALFIDGITAFPMVFSIACSHIIAGEEPIISYIGPFSAFSLLIPCINIAAFFALLQLVKPLGFRLANHVFKHDTITKIVLFSLLVFAASTQLTGINEDLLANFDVSFGITGLLILVLIIYIALRLRDERKRRRYLVRRNALVVACDDAMRSQSAFLEQSRGMLDDLANRINRIESAAGREELNRYLKNLRSTCDTLRFGTFSDNPLIDVMLNTYEEKFYSAGYLVEYRVSPLSSTGEQAALIVQSMLEWAYQVRAREGGKALPDSGNGQNQVRFRAFRHADQLLFEVRVSSGRGGRPYHMPFGRTLPGSVTVVGESHSGSSRIVRLMFEEGSE